MLTMKITLERQMSLLFCSKKASSVISNTIQCGENDTGVMFQKNDKNVNKGVQILCSPSLHIV